MEPLYSYVHGTPSKEDRRLEAWVTVAGHYVCDDYDTTVQGRKVSLLAYCVQGGGGLTLGGTHHPFARGDLMLQPAHLPNHCTSDTQHGWEVWWLMFGGSYASTLLDLIGLTPMNPILSLGIHEDVVASFAAIYETLANKAATMHLDASHQLVSLLYQLHKRNKELRLGGTESFRQVHYLSESVDQMAKASGYSKHHFIRLFKQTTGMTPWRYVLHLKIDKAKDFLLSSQHSIKEVATLVGIHNPLYFSRLFRKLTGKTPSQFRQQGNKR